MNPNLIFIIFVLSLMINRWVLPLRYQGFVYSIYGFAFIAYYSFSSALLWLIFSVTLILSCSTEKRLIRITFLISTFLLIFWLIASNSIVISFPYEFLIFFVSNLARGWAMFKHCISFKGDKVSLSEMISFLWFPPLLCGGPLEVFKEFRKYHLSPQSIAPMIVTGYFLSSIITGILRDFVRSIWSPSVFIYNEANLVQLLIYFVMVSILLFLHFISWIHFVRAFCHLLGYLFNNRNCGNFLLGGGLVEFWSRWNLSVTNFARDHLIYPLNRIPSNFETSLRILFWFSIVGFLFNFSIYTSIWGVLQGTAIILQIIYRKCCVTKTKLGDLNRRMPKIFKIICVFIWIFVTTPLLSPEAPILYQNIYERILHYFY